jgi:hypothetical protein
MRCEGTYDERCGCSICWSGRQRELSLIRRSARRPSRSTGDSSRSASTRRAPSTPRPRRRSYGSPGRPRLDPLYGPPAPGIGVGTPGKARSITPEQEEQILALLGEGRSESATARDLGISRNAVRAARNRSKGLDARGKPLGPSSPDMASRVLVDRSGASQRNPWRARVKIHGQWQYVGLFPNQEEAQSAAEGRLAGTIS